LPAGADLAAQSEADDVCEFGGGGVPSDMDGRLLPAPQRRDSQCFAVATQRDARPPGGIRATTRVPHHYGPPFAARQGVVDRAKARGEVHPDVEAQ
jgi:hypothetical protein